MLVAIIPARGNSKGVKDKNISLIGTNPLVDWAINLAKASIVVDQIVVSTESLRIVEKSLNLKKHKKSFEKMKSGTILKLEDKLWVHKRKIQHASHLSKTYETVMDVLRIMELKPQDNLILLQPTTPFRSLSEVKQAFSRFKSLKADSLISVRFFDSPHPAKAILIKDGMVKVAANKITDLSMPRQKLPRYFVSDGAYYISSVKKYTKNKTFIMKKTATYVRNGPCTINIDNIYDLQIAQLIYENKQIKFLD